MAQGQKTPPDIEEKVYATYLETFNYSETHRRTGVPLATCVDIVNRLKTDSLAELRKAMRADLAQIHWDKAKELVQAIDIAGLGTEKSSASLEAARALGEVGRIANLLDPQEKVDTSAAPPSEIHVHVDIPPRPEPGPTAQDSTLPKGTTT